MKTYESKDKVHLYASSMRIKKLQIKLNSNHYPRSEAQWMLKKKKQKSNFLNCLQEKFPQFLYIPYILSLIRLGKKTSMRILLNFWRFHFFFFFLSFQIHSVTKISKLSSFYITITLKASLCPNNYLCIILSIEWNFCTRILNSRIHYFKDPT